MSIPLVRCGSLQMAGIMSGYYWCPNPTLHFNRSIHGVVGIRCCSGDFKETKPNNTPLLLKLAVGGLTELLRLFSFSAKQKNRFNEVINAPRDVVSVKGVDDVLNLLKSDYENSYFVTGIFTADIYTEDCLFEDPTIRFRGTELYSRNLKLLVPFFDQPSIELLMFEKGVDSETKFVQATWKLRTYLKLPWRPFISVDGSTVYDLDDNFKIVRHAESWNISPLEAIGQIFTLSDRKLGD